MHTRGQLKLKRTQCSVGEDVEQLEFSDTTWGKCEIIQLLGKA